MVITDFQCGICACMFEVEKESIKDDFPKSPRCPNCEKRGRKGVGYRVYHKVMTQVPAGRLGNAADGYSGDAGGPKKEKPIRKIKSVKEL